MGMMEVIMVTTGFLVLSQNSVRPGPFMGRKRFAVSNLTLLHLPISSCLLLQGLCLCGFPFRLPRNLDFTVKALP